MIEISHAQARFLIRQSLDARAGDGRRLPDEQWLALQAHLENCAECQAYSRQVVGVEKGLQQVLAARWQNINGPEGGAGGGPNGLGGIVRERSIRRERRRLVFQWASRAGMAVLVVLAAAALVFWNRTRQMEAVSLPVATATPLVSPTPTPPAYFDGVVMYAGHAEGTPASDSEIFLLQSQGSRVETSNLTHNPAQDNSPVWSPDGEWIAFLSDRGGKPEVYVMTVAGSRVTQLTNEPEITWQGPLAWSPDGQWLALPGKRVEQGDVSWLYLVSMDRNTAAHPLAVPGSRGVNTLPRFVPAQEGSVDLVFQQPADLNRPESGLIISIQVSSGEQKNLTLLDLSAQRYLPSGGFDASGQVDVMNLVYIANTIHGSEIRSIRIPAQGSSQRFTIDQAAFGTVQDITLIPYDSRAAYLLDENQTGCWTINLRPYDLSSVRWAVPDLCVDGGLAPGQWASTGGWGMVTGHSSGQTGPAELFAVRVPPLHEADTKLFFYRLGEASGVSSPPLVRPSASRLAIFPQPANARVAPPPESPLPDPLPSGKVAISVPEGANSRIEMMDADGSNRATLQEADALNTCPVLSPDGRRLAYLSNRASIYPNLSQVFVRDLSRSGTPEVRLYLVHLDYAGYECPVWSPDGTSLAMVGHFYGLNYLAIFSIEENDVLKSTATPEARPPDTAVSGLLETGVYLTIEKPSAGLQPAWTPDSRSVYLGFPRRMGFPPVVYLYHWNGPGRDISSPGQVLTFSDGWEDILGLSVSPDGRQIALLAERSFVRSSETEGSRYAVLQIYDRSTRKLVKDWELSSYNPSVISAQLRLYWQADGQVVFSYPTDRFFSRAVSFIRFDPFLDTLQIRATSTDNLYDWTLIGNWLLFASESGLWGVTMSPGLTSPSVSPRWLSGEVVGDLQSIGQ